MINHLHYSLLFILLLEKDLFLSYMSDEERVASLGEANII